MLFQTVQASTVKTEGQSWLLVVPQMVLRQSVERSQFVLAIPRRAVVAPWPFREARPRAPIALVPAVTFPLSLATRRLAQEVPQC